MACEKSEAFEIFHFFSINQSVTALFVLHTVAVVGLTSKDYNNVNIDVSNIDITEAARIFPEVSGKA